MTDPRLEWSIPDSLFQREVVPALLVSLKLHHTNIRSADILIPVTQLHLPRLERLLAEAVSLEEIEPGPNAPPSSLPPPAVNLNTSQAHGDHCYPVNT
jgi:hypothetical protein